MSLAGASVRGSVSTGGEADRRPRHLDLIERYAEECPEALMADGFDEALIGRAERGGSTLLVYDFDKCVDVLMDQGGVDRDEAVEYMDFNVVGSLIENAPVFVET